MDSLLCTVHRITIYILYWQYQHHSHFLRSHKNRAFTCKVLQIRPIEPRSFTFYAEWGLDHKWISYQQVNLKDNIHGTWSKVVTFLLSLFFPHWGSKFENSEDMSWCHSPWLWHFCTARTHRGGKLPPEPRHFLSLPLAPVGSSGSKDDFWKLLTVSGIVFMEDSLFYPPFSSCF